MEAIENISGKSMQVDSAIPNTAVQTRAKLKNYVGFPGSEKVAAKESYGYPALVRVYNSSDQKLNPLSESLKSNPKNTIHHIA